MFIPRLAAAVLGAALSVPAAAFAQQAPYPAATAPAYPGGAPAGRRHHQNRFRAALRGLNLSQAQRQQIDQAFARTKAANHNADRTTRRANMQKLRSDVEAILTPAQRTQLQAALRKSRGQRRGGPFATPYPAPTPVH
jgi:Spy/CpxP family protein refolding chaperone